MKLWHRLMLFISSVLMLVEACFAIRYQENPVCVALAIMLSFLLLEESRN